MISVLIILAMLAPGVPAPKPKEWLEQFDMSLYDDEDDDPEGTAELGQKVGMHIQVLSMIETMGKMGAVKQLQITQWMNRLKIENNKGSFDDYRQVAMQVVNEIMAANDDFRRRLQEQLIAGDRKKVEAQLSVLRALIGPVKLLLGMI